MSLYICSMFPKSTHETFCNKLYQTFKVHKRFVKPKLSRTDFNIAHYAGEARYVIITFSCLLVLFKYQGFQFLHSINFRFYTSLTSSWTKIKTMLQLSIKICQVLPNVPLQQGFSLQQLKRPPNLQSFLLLARVLRSMGL